MLTPADKLWIRQTLAQLLALAQSAPAPMPRLTVAQFACAVELCPTVILRKIRCRAIPANLVFGERPKKISPRALDLFGVSPAEAQARLAAHSLWRGAAPSAESALDISAHRLAS